MIDKYKGLVHEAEEPQRGIERKEKELPPAVESESKPIPAEEGLDARVDTLRSEIQERFARPSDDKVTSAVPVERYGDFVDEERLGGRIILNRVDRVAIEAASSQLRDDATKLPALISGIPIAVEYRGQTNNFSTQTRIVSLSDGRKAFAVYSYAASSIHRVLDGVMKHLAGLRMGKVSRKNWKEQFEMKTEIPVIESSDPHTVLMPFIPNVNGYDVFVHNKEIGDFGEIKWANKVDLEKKLELVDKIIDELRRVHEEGKVWGEFILPNIIFTKEQNVVVCDPEIEYDEGVSSLEARARDIKDILHSTCSALAKAEGMQDFPLIVKRILDRYGDEEVIGELQKLAAGKRKWWQKLTFAYEQVRTGSASQQEYEEVISAIQSYNSES
jgi:hypothetical protein